MARDYTCHARAGGDAEQEETRSGALGSSLALLFRLLDSRSPISGFSDFPLRRMPVPAETANCSRDAQAGAGRARTPPVPAGGWSSLPSAQLAGLKACATVGAFAGAGRIVLEPPEQ